MVILLGGIFIYLRNIKDNFSKNKTQTTQKIIENLSIRQENFFEDENYIKEYKSRAPFDIEKKRRDAINSKVKDIMTNKRYVLQIATYSIKENALKTQSRLKQIDNFLVENSRINNKYYIVVSREFYSRVEAEALEIRVTEKFTDLKPLIKLRYDDGKSSKH